MTDEKRTRTAKPWTTDFDGMRDHASDYFGGLVRYHQEAGTLTVRPPRGEEEIIAEHLETKLAAYFWLRGAVESADRSESAP